MNPNEIMHYLNKLKEQSECLDKQVACVIVDMRGKIIAQGVNEVLACDRNCHDKENRICRVVHAEVVASMNINRASAMEPLTAYVNLFPCVPCQKVLASLVNGIVVFGPQHKDQVFNHIRLEPNMHHELIEANGRDKQLSVAQGELAELITAISDFFYRTDKLMPTEELADEIVDAELMIDQVKRLLWVEDPETYNILRDVRMKKFAGLVDKLKRKEI